MAPDGTPCDDAVACTTNDVCMAGVCHGALVDTMVAGNITTLTCPPVAMAVGGYVTPTCRFPQSLSWNLEYTGTVYLVSHLDRGFADFDIVSIGGGMFQLLCVYRNGDGDGVGGVSTFVTASSCTASADSFTCTD